MTNLRGYYLNHKGYKFKMTGNYNLSDNELQQIIDFYNSYRYHKNHTIAVYETLDNLIGFYFRVNLTNVEFFKSYSKEINNTNKIKLIVQIVKL